ncbi:MAG: outer membrane beta-barrel protein [Chitinophagaceae bacterium]|nr:outer membrane beta-barrel protein [Chitinophagaceae bacterium]
MEEDSPTWAIKKAYQTERNIAIISISTLKSMKAKIFLCLLCITGLSPVFSQDHTYQVGFTALAPWVNNYRFYNYDEQKKADKTGFIGVGAGLFYKNNNNKIVLSGSLTSDARLPFGEPEYAAGSVRSHIYAIVTEATYHRRLFHKIFLFAGPNWTHHWYRLRSSADSISSYNKFDQSIGLTTGVEYQVINQISAAVTYRPAIVSLDRKQYWHTLSLSARFHLILRKKQPTLYGSRQNNKMLLPGE